MTSPDSRKPRDRRQTLEILTWLAILAASTALVAAFLPWGRSGQTSRSSFQLIGVADRLDVLQGSARSAAYLWFVLPVLVGLAWLARSVGRSALAASLAATAGLICLAASELTVRSPLAVEYGATIARWAGIVAAGAAAAHHLVARSIRSA